MNNRGVVNRGVVNTSDSLLKIEKAACMCTHAHTLTFLSLDNTPTAEKHFYFSMQPTFGLQPVRSTCRLATTLPDVCRYNTFMTR